jgi:N-acetylmuramoyl-L-alanine amidase
VRYYWLLPSFLSLFLFSSPAFAGKLVFWRFDNNQNRLEFRTDDGVQPTAQLLANPTRLIIDLPGTTLGRPTVTQQLNGAMRSLRVGQFDDRTTRLVLELNPGYTLNPEQVRFRGLNPSQWSVQLPRPERVSYVPSVTPEEPLPQNRPGDRSNQPGPSIIASAGSAVQVQALQVTRDGFFIRTSGGEPQLKVKRNGDRNTIAIDIENATLSNTLSPSDIPVNRFGVSRVKFSQESPGFVRMTLNVSQDGPDWQPSFSRLGGGIVVLPNGTLGQTIGTPSSNPSDPNSSPTSPRLATIQSIDIASSGTMLLIRADRSVSPTSRWDSAAGAYRITIPSAQLADRVKGPQLDANSAVLRVRLQQQDSNTVAILVQPAAGVQIGELNQVNDQMVALQLLRTTRPSNGPISSTIVVPAPERPNPPPVEQIRPTPTPIRRPSNGRVLVIVDPGHGGKDSGAPGRGGVLEKDIVLSISQKLAALLEQQGLQVKMTRNSDYFVDLAPRVDMAQRAGADLFVSIHANSISGRPDVRGLETYHYGKGEGLARTIHSNILQSMDIPDRRVRSARFFVLRKNSMPAVLVETGYVSNSYEASRLSDPDYQNQMARAIARGIMQYIQQNL